MKSCLCSCSITRANSCLNFNLQQRTEWGMPLNTWGHNSNGWWINCHLLQNLLCFFPFAPKPSHHLVSPSPMRHPWPPPCYLVTRVWKRSEAPTVGAIRRDPTTVPPTKHLVRDMGPGYLTNYIPAQGYRVGRRRQYEAHVHQVAASDVTSKQPGVDSLCSNLSLRDTIEDFVILSM